MATFLHLHLESHSHLVNWHLVKESGCILAPPLWISFLILFRFHSHFYSGSTPILFRFHSHLIRVLLTFYLGSIFTFIQVSFPSILFAFHSYLIRVPLVSVRVPLLLLFESHFHLIWVSLLLLFMFHFHLIRVPLPLLFGFHFYSYLDFTFTIMLHSITDFLLFGSTQQSTFYSQVSSNNRLP